MTEGAAAALAVKGGEQQQQQGQQQEQQQQVQMPAWMENLPADSPYRQNADLLRMQSIEDVAKGYTETRTWAKGRIAIPTDDAGWQELGQRLRPESADAYKIDLPEGQDPAMANAFRQFAHDQGFPARYAEAAAQFFNQQTGEAMSKLASDNSAAIESVKLQHGPEGWARRVEATNKMLAAAGIEADVADALAQVVGRDGKPGAGKALEALFTLAERTGELGKIDPADVGLRMGTMTAATAKAEIDRLMDDEGFMAKAKVAGSPEAKRWNDLNMAMAKGA